MNTQYRIVTADNGMYRIQIYKIKEYTKYTTSPVWEWTDLQYRVISKYGTSSWAPHEFIFLRSAKSKMDKLVKKLLWDLENKANAGKVVYGPLP